MSNAESDLDCRFHNELSENERKIALVKLECLIVTLKRLSIVLRLLYVALKYSGLHVPIGL
jgi:hypothetical protein